MYRILFCFFWVKNSQKIPPRLPMTPNDVDPSPWIFEKILMSTWPINLSTYQLVSMSWGCPSPSNDSDLQYWGFNCCWWKGFSEPSLMRNDHNFLSIRFNDSPGNHNIYSITCTPESPQQYIDIDIFIYIHRQIAIHNTLSNSQHPLVKCCFLPSGCGPGCSNSRLAMRGKVKAVVRGRLGEELEACY